MKIVNVSYGYKFNKGNYETEDIALTADLEEGESAEEAIFKLKTLVKQLSTDKDERQLDFFSPKKGEGNEEKRTNEVKADKKSSKEKSPKGKTTCYSRASALHKKIVVDLFTSLAPNWKVELRERAKAASEALEGQEFLNEKGDVLDSFKKKAEELLLAKANPT